MKKRDPNQMDLFSMTSPESSSPPSTSTPSHQQDKPLEAESAASPSTGEGQGEGASTEMNPSDFTQEPDVTFDPSLWETSDSDFKAPSEPESVEALIHSIPQVESPVEMDPFESDPFFNPSLSSRDVQPPRATLPRVPLAEERLLEEIVQPTSSSQEDAPLRGPEPVPGATSVENSNAKTALVEVEAELEQARQEITTLRNRCASLEAERALAAQEADKERQWRTEAARNRPAATFKPAPQDLHARHRDYQDGVLSKRLLILALPGVLVLCLLAYSLGRRQSSGGVTIMEPGATPTVMEPPSLPEPPAPPPVHEQPVVAAWPAFEGTGYRVTGDNAARRVVFNYGAFARGAQLSEAAQRDLLRIAAAFRPDISAFRIEVEGHTDATPVRSTQAFADNTELAMARANAAMEFLTGKGGLPEDAVTAKAAGDKNPPYPGSTPEAQRKNRTVVLNITRR